MSILLQIVTDTAIRATSALQQAPPAAPPEMSLIDLIMKGGYIMIPLFLLSLIALGIFVERYLYIRKVLKSDPNFILQIKDALTNKNVDQAMAYCKNSSHPVARLIERAITRLGAPVSDIESIIENVANVEVSKMEKNMGILSAIAAVAPMLGFLGTVAGMIKAFYNISMANDISIGIIASGIYEKMVTSATGLIIGIVAYVFYTSLNNMIDRAVSNLEINSIDFLDLLYKPV